MFSVAQRRAGTPLHTEHVPLKFKIKIKCLDADFAQNKQSNQLFRMLPNLTNNINHCVTQSGVCANVSETALLSKYHEDVTAPFLGSLKTVFMILCGSTPYVMKVLLWVTLS